MKKLLFFVLFAGILVISSCSHQKNNIKLNNEIIERFINKCSYKYDSKIMRKCDEQLCHFYYTYNKYSSEIEVSHTYSNFFPLFEQGILHPALVGCFGEKKISIGSFKERRNPNDRTKRKYKLWRWCEGMANPCELTIRLSNKNADITSSTEEFLTGASLEYISECSLII